MSTGRQYIVSDAELTADETELLLFDINPDLSKYGRQLSESAELDTCFSIYQENGSEHYDLRFVSSEDSTSDHSKIYRGPKFLTKWALALAEKIQGPAEPLPSDFRPAYEHITGDAPTDSEMYDAIKEKYADPDVVGL